MEEVAYDRQIRLLRFDKGEEVIKELSDFCRSFSIHAACFSAIGVAQEVELAFYDLARREYDTVKIEEMVEIASVQGNVCLVDDKTVVHAHGVFSVPQKVWAGHINYMKVGVTCELELREVSDVIARSYDEDTGLNLLTSRR